MDPVFLDTGPDKGHTHLKTKQMCSHKLCKRNSKFNETGCSRSILDQTRFGHQIEQYKNNWNFQLLGWVVGHGEPRKPLRNETLGKHKWINIRD